jgi:hypothetical protein
VSRSAEAHTTWTSFSLYTILDAAVAILILFFGFWLYEIGNYVALSAFGGSAQIETVGIMPVATTATIAGNDIVWASKFLQALFVLAILLPFYYSVRMRRMRLSVNAIGCLVAMILASFYWEALSVLTFIPFQIHELIFASLSVVSFLLLLTTRRSGRRAGDLRVKLIDPGRCPKYLFSYFKSFEPPFKRFWGRGTQR